MPILRQFRQPLFAAAIVISAVALAACMPDTKTTSEAAALNAKVAELEKKVAYLGDRQQISDVYLRYMRGFDRNDVELLRSAFWPDVQINYGTQSNTMDDFIARHLNQHTKELATWGHLITNKWVEIGGDVAHAEAYVTALWTQKGDKATFAKGATIVSGRYIDRLDRRNGEWRIAVREFIPHFAAKTTSPIEFNAQDWSRSDCGMGTWDKRDPSYRRPLSARENKDIGPVCAE